MSEYKLQCTECRAVLLEVADPISASVRQEIHRLSRAHAATCPCQAPGASLGPPLHTEETK